MHNRPYLMPSKLQEDSRVPSRLKLRDVTGSEWAARDLTHSPLRTSHSLTAWSKDPLATRWDRGWKSTQNT
jgi:hypothetical protein